MRAAYLIKPKVFEIKKVTEPVLGTEEILDKVKSVSICRSDVLYNEHGSNGYVGMQAPMMLGHECSGEIFQLGNNII